MALTNGTVTDSATPSEAASTEQLCYQYSTIDKAKRAFRLLILRGGTGHDIDCEIVESTIDSNTLPYEAVSYTWGPDFTADTVNINGKKLPVTFNLSYILRDLRFADVDRVIWVDAICINQQDGTEKGHQVAQMQDIYALAERLLFCIAQPTSYTDILMDSLKGLQSEAQNIDQSDDSAIAACWSRTQTAIARHRLISQAQPSELLLSAQLEALTVLQLQGLQWIIEQPWFHRVWILQEVASARDALVSCGQKSVSAAVFALGARLLGYSLPDEQRKTVDEVLNLMPGLVRKDPSQDLLSLLRRFGKANASVERDRIYALFGICEDKKVQTHITPDYIKSDREVIVDTVAYICHCEISVIATTPYNSIALFLSDLGLFDNTLLSHFLKSINLKGALTILQRRGHSISVTPGMLSMAANDAMMEGGVMSLLLEQHNADTLLSGQEGWRPLLFAAEHGCDTLVRQMLEKGAFTETHDDRDFSQERVGWTPLILAAMNGHETVVKILLEKGADVSSHRHDPYSEVGTPLAWAARNGHGSIVQLLVEIGNMVDGELEKRTPLSWAVSKGHEAIVRLLLDYGADPTRKTLNEDDTPLSRAAENGHKVIVQILIESRAKVIDPYLDFASCIEFALLCAARAANPSVVSLLLEAGASNNLLDVLDDVVENLQEGDDRREDYEAIIMILLANGAYFREKSESLVTMAIAGNKRMVELLLDDGTEVDYMGTRSIDNHRKTYSGTALAFAVRHGHKDVAELLLAEGAYLESRDSQENTPLCRAAIDGYGYIVEMLLEKGADTEARDFFYRTPLLIATREGHENAVRVLLEKGADIEARDSLNCTPLLIALERGLESVVRVLLEKGADIEVRDSCGRTPLLVALKRGHESVFKVLLEKGADIEARASFDYTPLLIAVVGGHESVFKVLLENGADTKIRADGGFMSLHLAAYFDKAKIIRILLENGADTEIKEDNGFTPLHLAAHCNKEKIIRILLENGADIESRREDGRTALCSAVCEGHKNVVKVLLDNGADIEATDCFQCTPLTLAANRSHEDIVMLLLESGANPNVDMTRYKKYNYID